MTNELNDEATLRRAVQLPSATSKVRQNLALVSASRACSTTAVRCSPRNCRRSRSSPT
jgi:Flp pilus assembly protein TadD